MESFFAHNDLNIDFDDIKSLEEYTEAFQKLNDFEQQHISIIQDLENSILQNRKVLSEKYYKLLSIQEQAEKLDKLKKVQGMKKTLDKLEVDFSESLSAYLINYNHLSCNINQKLERVVIPLANDLGNEFIVYIDPTTTAIQRICVASNDEVQAERELKKEEILAIFFDITDAVNRDIKKENIPQSNPDKLLSLEMGNLLLEYMRENKF